MTTPSPRPWRAPQALTGYQWRAERPRATLLLQHGYAEHARRYVAHGNRLIPQLVARGIDVYAFDLAGHGGSRGRRGDTDIRQMVAAHIDARRSLAASGRPLFLFGHSLGGLVTAASVAKAPHRVAGVVLSAPSLPTQIGRWQNLALQVLARIRPLRGVSPRGKPDDLTRIKREALEYAQDPLVLQMPLPARIAATAVATARHLPSRFKDWTCPTLVLHGTADKATDPRGSRRLIEAIAADDKQLDLIPDALHELLNDLPRDDVVTRILDWIDAHIPAEDRV